MTEARPLRPNEVHHAMATNPTHNPDEYSKQLIQNEIRPGIETYLGNNFSDPEASNRGASISGGPGEYPPLVVTSLPGGGRVLYPHVVVAEQGDDSDRPDPARPLRQHDFAVDVEVHGRTDTEMFNMRDTVRGWFLRNWESLRDAGLAEPELSSNGPADWDNTSRTETWSMTISGLVHTHPNSTTDLS